MTDASLLAMALVYVTNFATDTVISCSEQDFSCAELEKCIEKLRSFDLGLLYDLAGLIESNYTNGIGEVCLSRCL